MSICLPVVPLDDVSQPCRDDDALHAWLGRYLDIDVPRTPVCPGHHAPFEYVRTAYFEPAQDIVVWAPRGGGKTRLAAAVTLLDLLHKPGTAVRILGGSLDQSLRMWDHLLPDLERIAPEQMIKTGSRRTLRLRNGSSVAVLTQSQRAVRGLRVQKMRCDEVELFKPDIWEASQLVTRSIGSTRGTVEAISTLHAPWGLMSKILTRAEQTGTKIVRWCLLEVLQRCPSARPCEPCALWKECRGIAKIKCDGFVLIDDAIAMKSRVSRETWESEILCQRPSLRGAVFPRFDPDVHVRDATPAGQLSLGVDFGFANPFVCLWIVQSDDGAIHVIDEYAQVGLTIHDHIEQVQSRPWGKPLRLCCDPAGKARNDQTARSNVDALKSAGYVVRTRRSQINEGVEMIRTALCPASGEPKLFVHPRCVRLIRALQGYRYKEDGGETPFKDGEHDHYIDALRYYFVNSRKDLVAARSY
jgi:hypothetical protein